MSPKRKTRRVEEVRKIHDIEDHYRISYEPFDLLGQGAFATVRLATKVIDNLDS